MSKLILFMLLIASANASSWEEKVVAAVIVAEAGGEGRIGMTCVGEVIAQRVRERHQTPLRVVTMRGEFSSKNGRSADAMVRKFSRSKSYATALGVAEVVCEHPERLPGLTKSANYFDHKNRHPWWAEHAVKVAVVRNHAFYKIRD